MRVAIITPYKSGVGGVETVNALIAKILTTDGHQVEFITTELLPWPLRRWLPTVFRPAILSLAFNRRAKRYNLVLCNGEYGFGIRHPRCINIVHGSCHGLRHYLHGHINWLDDLILRLKAWLLASSARGKYVITVSEFMKSILEQQGIVVDKIINNSVNTNTFMPSAVRRTIAPYLFVGYYSYFGKGFDILKKLASRGLLIDCVTNREPGEGLNWLRNVDNSKMPEVYHKHRIMVFPSRYEGLQMAPLEAMACGLPVIISNVGLGPQLKKRIPEFVIDGWDDAAVEMYLQRIRQIENDYDMFADKARKYVITYHGLERFTSEWQQAIKYVCVGQ